MHEIACPACNTPSSFDFRDYILTCPFCSSSFKFDVDSGLKEIFSDHYIVPNTSDPRAVKELVHEWLKRLHHRPGSTSSEFFVTDIKGMSIPYWVVSLEGHSYWKGLVSRKFKNRLETHAGADYLVEAGQFRRSYRWAICARQNLCESWGMTRLHEPQEQVQTDWDGFPLDSTFSRGRLSSGEESERSAYDIREFFDFKFANGLPIAGVQINEEEALRRAQNHVNLYHYKLAKLNVDFLVDIRTELEIAGIQLLHLPFWHAKYIYRPRTALRHFYQPKEKNVLLDGYGKGVLKGELAIIYQDKIIVNAFVCAAAAIVFLLLGAAWHPAFFLIALFTVGVGVVSVLKSAASKKAAVPDDLMDHGGLRTKSIGVGNETVSQAG